MRSLYDGKLYVILDNFSPHQKNEMTSWCKKKDIELVFLPTNASWLNRIECHFTALRKFAIRNSNYKSHAELASAIRRYIKMIQRRLKESRPEEREEWRRPATFLAGY